MKTKRGLPPSAAFKPLTGLIKPLIGLINPFTGLIKPFIAIDNADSARGRSIKERSMYYFKLNHSLLNSKHYVEN
jgi:hypothetical protein